jgi:hypothetical protein
MTRTSRTWVWSLGVVAHSYRTVVVVAAFIALWAFLFYQWLGMPAESSAPLFILAVIWALAQLLAAVAILAGIVLGAVQAAAADEGCVALPSLVSIRGRSLLKALAFLIVGFFAVWACGSVFHWFDEHSLEVASFLTFHFQKPVSSVVVQDVYDFIEGLLWIVIGGFLLSFFIALLRAGWRPAFVQARQLLAACAFRSSFLTSLLTVVVFGGLAYELTDWRPVVPPGFWDYTQMLVRFSLVLLLVSSGVMFWLLALARQQIGRGESDLS